MTVEFGVQLVTLLLVTFQAGGLVATVRYMSKRLDKAEVTVEQHAKHITELKVRLG